MKKPIMIALSLTFSLSAMDSIDQQATPFKGNWTETFILKNGDQVDHTPTSVKLGDICSDGGVHVNMPVYNGLPVSPAGIHLDVNSTREEFLLALYASNLYGKEYPKGYDYFAGETGTVGVCDGLTDQEKEMTPEEKLEKAEKEYDAAMELWDEAIHDALARLLEAERLGSPKAKKKLDEIRKLRSYKEPKKAKENDPGRLLKTFEPSASELYRSAMGYMGKDNACALTYFMRAADLGSKDANKKLTEMRKSKRYIDASQRKTDSIEYLLYQKDKSNGNLATPEKKGTKITSPSVQTPRNELSSQRKQPRQKNTQKGDSEKINITTAPISTSSKKERRLQGSKPIENSGIIINGPIVENTPPDPIQLESVNTPIFETPQTNLEVLERNTVPVIQENKPVSVINIASDQLPTGSREESGGLDEIIASPKQPLQSKIRKTLSRRNSLNLEKEPKDEENTKPKTIRRTQSLMNLKPEPQNSEIMGVEEPKGKKKKEPSTRISLKKHLTIRKTEKKLERQKSKGNLFELASETSQGNNQVDQPGSKTTNPFKKLARSLSDRDLRTKSDVSLDESDITSTLDKLQENGIIDWTRKGNTISATKKDDQDVHITIHTHNKSDRPWSGRAEIVSDFLEFSSECDEDLKETISQIGTKKSSKK